jgi:hypothetical protein
LTDTVKETCKKINLESPVLAEGPEDGVLVGGVSSRGAHGEQCPWRSPRGCPARHRLALDHGEGRGVEKSQGAWRCHYLVQLLLLYSPLLKILRVKEKEIR